VDNNNVEATIESSNNQNEVGSIVAERNKRTNILREITEPQQLMSSARIGGWYVPIVIGVLSVLWVVLSLIGGIFNPTQGLFSLITLAMPTLAVAIGCFILRKVQTRKGDQLVKHIMILNFAIYFLVVLFINITSVSIWITYAIAFIPVFIVSFFFFRKIEGKAAAIEDTYGKVIDFSTTKFADGITDNSFRKFLTTLNLGDINYFSGIHFNGKIEDKRIKPVTHYMIAFDTEQIYMFEVNGKKISHLNVFHRQDLALTRKFDLINKRRIELYPTLIEVSFNEKGFNYQEEMLNRFMGMFPFKV